MGALLRQWRLGRRMSQLDLGLHAGVSARHLSFIETGRAGASRDMILRLSEALDIPLRERNRLLERAGFTPAYRQSPPEGPAMADAWRMVEFILTLHEPYFTVVLDRYWNVLASNRGARRMLAAFGRRLDQFPGLAPNILRITFHPDGMRPFITNWEDVASMLLMRVQRMVAAQPDDAAMAALRDELASYPGVPQAWTVPAPDDASPLVFPLQFGNGSITLNCFSTYTMFGKPQDIALEELLIESVFPADAPSRALLHGWADDEAMSEAGGPRYPAYIS